MSVKKSTKKTVRKVAAKKVAAKSTRQTSKAIVKSIKRAAKKSVKRSKAVAKRAVKTVAKKIAAKYPYVLKSKFLQVTVDGVPFTLESSHPTFAKMSAALKAKNWKAVPRLVTLAKSMFSASSGDVQVKNGEVYYKGSKVASSLTKRIVEMVNGKKEFKHMLAFMNNLYKNPSREAIGEFYDWLIDNHLPITDDGCFLAYKSVDGNLKDKHTHKIDNSPGKVISMKRNDANLNWRTQCEAGFHICSKQYGLYGSRILAVKVNPKDVIAANSGKMRVLRYEVIRELGRKSDDLFIAEGFSELEKQLVVEVKKERKELVAMILKSPKVKRLIRNGKLKASSVKSSNYARLKTMAEKFQLLPSESTDKAK